MFRWKCKDRRYTLKGKGTSDTTTATITATCRWNETYSLIPADLECVLTYCGHPHLYATGSHAPPPVGNYLDLVTPSTFPTNDSYDIYATQDAPGNVSLTWHLIFGTKINYTCQGTKHIEMPDPPELDPSQTVFSVECLDTGVYNTPVLNNKLWPNCTQTVRCGQPPDMPANGRVNGTDGHNGSITWLNNAPTGRDVYDTWVQYECAVGSQFDAAPEGGDGKGDAISLKKRCRWDKSWTPAATLPACYVTHCIHPYPIPFDTYLEEVTSNWTEVNQKKHYQCKGWGGSRHTRFWESDRSKSTFEIKCLEDGSYSFDNKRESWPTCIEDIICEDEAPEVPTHSEYTLSAYDGTVTINSLVYPSLTRTRDMIRNSKTSNSSTLPRNYMANLTYTCGSARMFLTSDGEVDDQNMTCQWDKTWSPTHVLEDCDWVACLKPPPIPASTGLLLLLLLLLNFYYRYEGH